MADTALTLITDALLDLGVLADEESPTASQAAGGLRKLNNLIDAWNIEGLMVYGTTQSILPLTAGVGQYTLGSGGTMNIPRPNTIVAAYVEDTTLPLEQRYDFPLYMYTVEEYADVGVNAITSPLPLGIFIDDSFPLSNVYLWPVPSTTNYNLILWSNGILNNLSLYGVVGFANGYKRALTANLCEELAPSYGVQVPQSVAKIAAQSKADLKLNNFSLNELKVDDNLYGKRYNGFINSGIVL